MRAAYLTTAIVFSIIELFNGPRLLWIPHEDFEPIGLFRGFQHGLIGFSYLVSWSLIIGGIYQIVLGILYWDMDTSERKRWLFTLESLGTARLLWVLGGISLLLGVAYVVWVYGHDNYIWPAGIGSTVWAWLTCGAFWMSFPLYDQVGIDRDEVRSLNI
jgi:hypothetical protein